MTHRHLVVDSIQSEEILQEMITYFIIGVVYFIVATIIIFSRDKSLRQTTLAEPVVTNIISFAIVGAIVTCVWPISLLDKAIPYLAREFG